MEGRGTSRKLFFFFFWYLEINTHVLYYFKYLIIENSTVKKKSLNNKELCQKYDKAKMKSEKYLAEF